MRMLVAAVLFAGCSEPPCLTRLPDCADCGVQIALAFDGYPFPHAWAPLHKGLACRACNTIYRFDDDLTVRGELSLDDDQYYGTRQVVAIAPDDTAYVMRGVYVRATFDFECDLTAYSARGERLWRQALGRSSGPLSVEAGIEGPYVGTQSNSVPVRSFAAEDGSLRWELESAPVLLTPNANGGAYIVSGDQQTLGAGKNTLRAVDATGTPRWSRVIEASSGVFINRLILTPDGGFAIGGSFSGVADFGNGPIVAEGGSRSFVTVYAADGIPAWMTFLPAGIQVGPMAAMEDEIVIGGGLAAAVPEFGLPTPQDYDAVLAVVSRDGVRHAHWITGAGSQFIDQLTLTADGAAIVVVGSQPYGDVTFGHIVSQLVIGGMAYFDDEDGGMTYVFKLGL